MSSEKKNLRGEILNNGIEMRHIAWVTLGALSLAFLASCGTTKYVEVPVCHKGRAAFFITRTTLYIFGEKVIFENPSLKWGLG